MQQLLGLIILNGEFIIKVNDILLTPAIILAAIFSGVAFILGYFRNIKIKIKVTKGCFMTEVK
ncbi:hypothetical protein J4710_09990 [Staphylococcus xylosus]|uniref:Uncharacterized protein n=1 Tax=Staphylococcus xylosus TaxID=1288 RepID=A0A939SS44_STAXY|nr:hypothetical protein [Staphylococcus xylosus]